MAKHTRSTENPTKSNVPELVIERVFDAPREAVFDAWVDGAKVKRWSSPEGFSIPESSGDARPGGKWRARMRGENGKDLVVQGDYLELVRPERIVSTHVWLDEKGKPGGETLMIVALEERGDQTAVTFRQSGFEGLEDRNGHEAGWNECFDKLEELLASEVVAPVRR